MKYSLDFLTDAVIGAAIRIHKTIGSGLLESAYELLLFHELRKMGFKVERQMLVSFTYNDIQFRNGFRIDLLIESELIVEIKSLEQLNPAHKKQVLTYLRLMQLPVGLLLNFGGETLKEGLHRIVNELDPGTSPLLRVNSLTPLKAQ